MNNLIADWIVCPVCGEEDDVSIPQIGEHIVFECGFCETSVVVHLEGALDG